MGVYVYSRDCTLCLAQGLQQSQSTAYFRQGAAPFLHFINTQLQETHQSKRYHAQAINYTLEKALTGSKYV